MFYEAYARWNTPDEKSVTIAYCILCDLFTEAEAKALTDKDPIQIKQGIYIDPETCEKDVYSLRRSKVIDILNEDKDLFFKATIEADTLDEKGEEKAVKYEILIGAEDIQKAYSYAEDYMKQGLSDMTLVALKKTKIKRVILK